MIAAIIGLVFGANTAMAARPACFAERTLLGPTIPLFDDHGNQIGAARGQTVRVLEDHVGPNGQWADLQIDRPIALRARVKRDQLFVFLRHDLAIVRGESWWTRDAPMRIVDRKGTGVLVEPELGSQGMGDTTLATSCDNLDGTAGKRLTCDMYSCRVDFAAGGFRAAGNWVELPDGSSIEVQIGPGVKTSMVSFSANAIRRRGSQTLVEIADPWHQLRVRRWLPTAGLGADKDRGQALIPGDLEAAGSLGLRGDLIVHPTPLSATPGGAAFATLPIGVAYRVLEMRDGHVRVIARWPSWENDRFVDVRGWTRVGSLPFLPDPGRTADAIRGRVTLAADLDRKVMKDLVAFADDGEGEPGRPAHSTTVAPDGTFFLEVGEPRAAGPVDRWDEGFDGLQQVRVVVRNKDGALSGVANKAPALAGGADESPVLVGHSIEIEGVAETKTGARMPSEEVRIFAADHTLDAHPVLTTTTGPDGAFHFLVPPDDYVIMAGDDASVAVDAHKSPAPVAVRMRRRPVVFGAVPRASNGHCVAATVNADIENEGPKMETQYRVTGDCLFVAEELPRQVNASRFWIRLPDGTELEELRSTYVSSEDDRDPAPVCLRDPCPPNVIQSSVMIDVTDAAAVLVRRAQVEARVDDRVIGTCTAASGRCYIHHLAPGSLVRVSALVGAAGGEGTLRLAPGVNEVLIRTSARSTP